MREGLRRIKLGSGMTLGASPAAAHVSEQSFVLLLPTDIYIGAGVACVALTVAAVAVLPAGAVKGMFRTARVWRPNVPGRLTCSCLSFALLVWLIWLGVAGPRDPLSNLLPLTIWTLWWIGFVALQGLLGNLWRWVTPWDGPLAVMRWLGVRPVLRFPRWGGYGVGILGFLTFSGMLLADPAPADPARLARLVSGYWIVSFVGALLFGRRWMFRAEWVGMLMRIYAQMGVFGRGRVGLPGWRVLAGREGPLGLALFMLLLLGSGSFDGLNETFWWLAVLGVNPLEFPGRSAVIGPTLVGVLVANVALIAAFAATVWLGVRLAGVGGFAAAFRLFAPSILPIALGYHIAHYLTAFLVDSQYALAALSDPLARGEDWLGLGTFYVTTGFFNTQGSVRVIWLSQAGAVVIGHVLAILLAHGLAVRRYGPGRQALLAHAPLAVFMVVYTLFGLWLLAAPRGA